MPTNLKRYVVAALFAIVAASSFAACEHEGPAERAGKAVDNAAEDVKDKVKDATN
jgi:hypothetical protein